MSLSICLDTQRPYYSGNEKIRGHVIFRCANSIDIQDVRVTFTGCAETKIQKVKGSAAPSAAYRSKCVLFEKEKILSYLNGQTLERGAYKWPIEFDFPSHEESPEKSKWPDQLPFRNDANHPLPPTFAAKTEDSMRKITCEIAYQIEAQVCKPQRGFISLRSPLFSEVAQLKFMPPTAKTDVGSDQLNAVYRRKKEQLFDIRSLLILPENKGRSLSIQEKIRSWLSPSHLPRFDFVSSFSYPTQTIQSTPLKCSLDIIPLMEDSSVMVPPDILMRSLHITLISRTSARAAPSLIGSMFGDVDERIQIVSRTSLNMAVSGTVDLEKACGPLVFRQTDVSFTTYNISRSYRLCVSAEFECAGKTVRFEAPDLPIDITACISESEKKNLESREQAPEMDSPPSYASSLSTGISNNTDMCCPTNKKEH